MTPELDLLRRWYNAKGCDCCADQPDYLNVLAEVRAMLEREFIAVHDACTDEPIEYLQREVT